MHSRSERRQRYWSKHRRGPREIGWPGAVLVVLILAVVATMVITMPAA